MDVMEFQSHDMLSNWLGNEGIVVIKLCEQLNIFKFVGKIGIAVNLL